MFYIYNFSSNKKIIKLGLKTPKFPLFTPGTGAKMNDALTQSFEPFKNIMKDNNLPKGIIFFDDNQNLIAKFELQIKLTKKTVTAVFKIY